MDNRKHGNLFHFVVIGIAFGLEAFGVSGSPAFAKNLKLAHFLPPIHTNHTKVMAPWAEEVGKRSNGSLTIKVYPGRQLGGTPPGQFKMVVSGTADIAFFTPNYTPGIFPRTSVLELPVPPKDSQHATRILYALFDKYLAEEYKAVKMITMWSVDEFIVVTKKKPIRKLEDIKGLKLRSPSQTKNMTIKALGGIPINMPITEVFTAMDTGVIDGLVGGGSIVFSFKIIDVGKYYTFGTPLSTMAVAIGMNKKVWKGLSPEHKKIIEETSQMGLGMKGAIAYDKKFKAAVEVIKKKPGREIIMLPEAERKRFREASGSVIEDWIAKMGKKGIPGKEIWKARLAVK